MINELLKSPAGFFSFWYDLIVMEDNFPRIDFIYNSETDADYAVGFLSEPESEDSINFLKRFLPDELHSILESQIASEQKEKLVRNYTADYYAKNEEHLKNKFELTNLESLQ